MSLLKNYVMEGDYKSGYIEYKFSGFFIRTGRKTSIKIDKNTVEDYEVMDTSTSTSATSAVSRGLIGSLLLGPVGAAAALSAKKKNEYMVAIQFKDGKKSLLLLNDMYYKLLIQSLF